MNIYIVRHGRTVYNEEERMQGSSDSPLLESSLTEAYNLGKAFKVEGIEFDAAYSSDLIRTIHTAEQIIKGMDSDLSVQEIYNIREMHFGSAEAQPIAEVWTKVAQEFNYKDSEDLLSNKEANERLNLLHQVSDFKDAESTEIFHTRIKKGLDELVNDAKSNGKKNVLVVAHGLTILGLLAQLGWSEEATRGFDNLSVSLVTYDSDYAINFVNKMYV